jgi:hypothetical protein
MGSRNFDLQYYATEKSYNDICIRRWTRHYDFSRFEADWQALRSGEKLQLRHIQELFDKQYTHFGHFWKEPSNLGQQLADRAISLSLSDSDEAGGPREQEMVEILFQTLESMEPASILLRCVHPTRFGIYSPPILAFLQIPVASPVQHYLEVCKELRCWSKHFHLKSAGETDRALWVFYEHAYGPQHLEQTAQLRESFENDRWVQERQAFNVLHKFLKSYPTIKQATFLAAVDPNLAGKIAGCHFERVLRSFTKIWDEDTSVRRVINRYVRMRRLPPDTREALQRVWDLRCDTIHSRKELTAPEAQQMIQTINRLLPPQH